MITAYHVITISALIGGLFVYAILIALQHLCYVIETEIIKGRETKLLSTKSDSFIINYIKFQNELKHWSETKKNNKW